MKTLLILNYAMDEKDSTFPHQISIVRDLAKEWSKILVITYKVGTTSNLPQNVEIVNWRWDDKHKTKSVFLFLFKSIRIMSQERGITVFSHMTESLSALIGPITKILQIKHFLWYAHKSRPIRLIWCSWFVTKIITSTRNSCPISKKDRVIAIGQAVDHKLFQCDHRKYLANKRAFTGIHVGRVDPSKRIDLIIEMFLENFKERESKLHLVGAPTKLYGSFYYELQQKYMNEINSHRIIFHGKKNPKEIRDLLCKSDFFLHAFQGSLDKSLVEAVFAKAHVITCNKEFIIEFSNPDEFGNIGDENILRSELLAFKTFSLNKLKTIAEYRYDYALLNHSREQWLQKLKYILKTE